MPASTKRRRDGDDLCDPILLDFSHAYYTHEQQHHTSPPRKLTLYSSNKLRPNAPPSDGQQPHPQRQPAQVYARSASKPRSSPKPKPVNLSPCHICHRRPTKKTDLDAYADCEGCGERTCFVCIRQCLRMSKGSSSRSTTATYDSHHEARMTDDGPTGHAVHDEDEKEEMATPTDMNRSFSMEEASPTAHAEDARLRAAQGRSQAGGTWGRGGGAGHRERICSQCCVELGTQGEVRCLGCLET